MSSRAEITTRYAKAYVKAAKKVLRNSVKVRKAGDEVEDEPGFFEGDTVAHCAAQH